MTHRGSVLQKIFASFPQNAGDLKKKQKKRSSPTNSQIFRKIQTSKTFFCKFSRVLQDETTLLMTLAHFQLLKNSAVLERRTGHF